MEHFIWACCSSPGQTPSPGSHKPGKGLRCSGAVIPQYKHSQAQQSGARMPKSIHRGCASQIYFNGLSCAAMETWEVVTW